MALVRRYAFPDRACYFQRMGLVNGKLSLQNPRLPNVAPVDVVALVDSGALLFAFPSTFINSVGTIDSKSTLEMAQKNWFLMSSRECTSRIVSICWALVWAIQVLLGAIPMRI